MGTSHIQDCLDFFYTLTIKSDYNVYIIGVRRDVEGRGPEPDHMKRPGRIIH